MESGLAGRRYLITGASGGIGRATATMLAAERSELVLHYGANRQSAEALAAELGGGLVVAADLRVEAEVEAMFERALADGDPIDGLVVNAGVWCEESVPVHEMSLEQWCDTLAVNLTGAFLCCRAFLRHLAETPRKSAAIVLVSSTAGLFGEEGHGDYAASKAALAYGLTSTLKNEIVRLAPRGRVNCVCPGWVDTPMAAAAMEDAAAVERATSTMALRKIATPEDIGAAIVFLLSDRLAGHLSGTLLPVAGGMEGRRLHEGGPEVVRS